jgi:hypothetical protein
MFLNGNDLISHSITVFRPTNCVIVTPLTERLLTYFASEWNKVSNIDGPPHFALYGNHKVLAPQFNQDYLLPLISIYDLEKFIDSLKKSIMEKSSIVHVTRQCPSFRYTSKYKLFFSHHHFFWQQLLHGDGVIPNKMKTLFSVWEIFILRSLFTHKKWPPRYLPLNQIAFMAVV